MTILQENWVVDERDGRYFIGPFDKKYGGVAAVVCSIEAHPARLPVAYLIASAPLLLKALKLAKDHAELEDEVLDIVDEAINSAETGLG